MITGIAHVCFVVRDLDAYSDDSALLFRRKAPGSSEGFGPGFPSDCGHVFRVNRPFCTGRIGA